MTEFQAGAYRPASLETASWLLGRGPFVDLGSYERAKSFASGDGRNSYGPRVPEPVDPLVDVALSVPAAARSVAEGAVGAGGDFSGFQGWLAQLILEKTGASQEQKDRLRHITSNLTMWSRLPSSEGIRRNVTDPVLGRNYQPRTTAGRYAYTGTEFLGGALLPGGPIRKTAMVAIPAVASETAGQLTENTAWEPWARLFGALGGAGFTAVSPQRMAQAAAAFARSRALTDTKIALIRALQQRGYSLETIKRALANSDAAKAVADRQQFPGQSEALGPSGAGADTASPAWSALERAEAYSDNWRESLAAFLRQELDGRKPMYYLDGPAKWVGPLGNRQGPTITQPYGRMKSLLGQNRHHLMQQATIRDFDEFRKGDGPSIYLDGPVHKVGSQHYSATQMQRRLWADNVIDEVLNAIEIVESVGGLSPELRYQLEWEMAEYLKYLDIRAKTPIRVPGNRRRPK